MIRETGHGCSLQSRLICPQSQRRVTDEIDSFAAGQRVPAVPKLLRVVALEHRRQVGVFVADAFYFVARQVAGAVGNVEPPFRRSVN